MKQQKYLVLKASSLLLFFESTIFFIQGLLQSANNFQRLSGNNLFIVIIRSFFNFRFYLEFLKVHAFVYNAIIAIVIIGALIAYNIVNDRESMDQPTPPSSPNLHFSITGGILITLCILNSFSMLQLILSLLHPSTRIANRYDPISVHIINQILIILICTFIRLSIAIYLLTKKRSKDRDEKTNQLLVN